MVTFLLVLAAIVLLALVIGHGTAGSTGVVDRDAQRIDAELAAIAGYAANIRPGLH
ncbi:hypothetical protein [Nocardia asteroides]|uniref:hypothetical protein n=1 Tax=Nocardia asteroides TaxID=1824 RepID=UPI001E4DEFB4|nr:hypothetical protein [Nocardia asteroides]UGT54480.1 hypothetical protein LTT85_28220 [Nocardia asteroides]